MLFVGNIVVYLEGSVDRGNNYYMGYINYMSNNNYMSYNDNDSNY